MVGNAKCDSKFISPEDLGFPGSYANGSRGANHGVSLERLGSFRENSNGRPFGSGASMSKGKASDLPPISQCLMLEPITLSDQKHSRSLDLRRALSFSVGTISEDNSSDAAHSKPVPPLAVDELNRLRGSVQDGNDKARVRVKRLDENLNKLTAYLRKLQINERSSDPSLLKTGAKSHMKSPDLVTHVGDDRGKSALNKRPRTPSADMRLDGWRTGIPRQHMILGKDKDIKQGSLNSDSVEEKMCRLPAGGESWDKKMKRKRSVSNVFPRPIDGDGEIKRAMHGRLGSDSRVPSSGTPSLRLSSNGAVGNTKPDGTPSASGSSIRSTPKIEMDKVSFSTEHGGMNKDEIFQKGNNKLSMCDESHLANPCLIPKGKASQASGSGPPITGDSSPFSHMASTLEDWELPSNVNKLHSLGGIHNRKRAFSSESSSPQMTQWVGQRQQKSSRIRRSNIMSPTSKNNESVISPERCSASGYVLTSGGFNGSLPARNMASNIPQIKVKSEDTPSPARLSEGEDTGSFEGRAAGSFESEDRVANGYLYVASPGLLAKKNGLLVNEEIGDGVRKQGRGGRGSSPATAKPVNTKPGSDKNGSKSGRPPLKKNSERKGFTRLGLVPNGYSPDCTGESDDDREDLLAAAHFTCSANYLACSSTFWKKMEPLFSITVDDESHLMEKLKPLAEHQESASEKFISDNDVKYILREEKHQSRIFQPEGEKVEMSYGFEPIMSMGLVNQSQQSEGEHNSMPSLHQRVLSALITEDEFAELEQNNCNGDTHSRSSSVEIPFQDNLLQGDCSLFLQSEVGVFASPRINMSINSSSQGHYVLMSMDEKLEAELQSIGLHPETVSDFAEGEDEVFPQEIIQLKKKFCQEANRKKLHLEKIWKAVEVEKELKQWELEQVAMSRLVVLAYRKLQATRGNTAGKMGVSKVPRHVALAFVKRTLARCHKFEDTGKSCFGEPALRDVIFACPPPCSIDGLTDHNLQSEAKAPGTYSTGTEQPGVRDNKPERKKEVLLDYFGSGPALKPPPLENTLMGGGVKGKRSERDRNKGLSAKSGRLSITNLRGERKAKSNPKQRTAQLSTHPVFPSTSSARELVTNGSVLESSKDPIDLTNLQELDSIGLGVDSNQDLSSWFNLDEDILPEHDSMGLEIPMDDLSDLNMIL